MAKDKIKIGLIATGGIAQWAHIPGYLEASDECEIVWACDIKEDLMNEIADKYDIPNRSVDYRDILADPTVDAVSVMTPNLLHMQPTIDALEAGKHVLCEKPMSMNAEQSKAMCRAAEKSGKILQIGLQQRFTGPGQWMKKYIDGGNMGDIYYARAQALRRRGVPGWGVFIDKEKQGGGPLIDIGVHILDFTLYLMGYPTPVSATGKTWDMLGKDPNIVNLFGDYDRTKFTVEDMAVGFIRFDNGAVITLESSFMANIDSSDPYNTQLFGTKGGAEVSFYKEKGVKIYTEANQQLMDITPANMLDVPYPHRLEIKAFLEAIREGKESPVPGRCGLILNAVFDALYKSAQTGKEEAIDISL